MSDNVSEKKSSVFNNNKNKKKSSFAFVEDNSNEEKKAKTLEEFTNGGRGQNKRVPNPKGRPKVVEDELKKEVILIYATKKQKEELVERAQKNNLSVSKYISVKIFGLE